MLTKGGYIEDRFDKNLKLIEERNFKKAKHRNLAGNCEVYWEFWVYDNTNYERLLENILTIAEEYIEYEIGWYKSNRWSVTANDIFSYVQEKVWLGMTGEEHFVTLKEGYLVYESILVYIKGLCRNYKTKIKGKKVKWEYWHLDVYSIEGYMDDRTMSKTIKASSVVATTNTDYSNKEDYTRREYINVLCEDLKGELTSSQLEVLEIMLEDIELTNIEIAKRLGKSEGSIRKIKKIIQRKGTEFYEKVRIQ